MPPVVAFAGAVATSFATAAATATVSAGIATGASTATIIAAANFSQFAFQQLASAVVMAAISRALQPNISGTQSGERITLRFGEENPGSCVFGTYGVSGELLYANSWGKPGDKPNEYYVEVRELSDLPSRFSRIWMNGEWATLGDTPARTPAGNIIGYPVDGYRAGGEDRLFVKFLDGTQVTADPYLREKFGDDEDRPWTSEMVGYGLTVMIVTAGMRRSVNHQKPEYMTEISSWGLYDRRQDSTAGGSGAQRWNNWRTWKPSTNPIVMLDNALRGIRDPITGEHLWGGQFTNVNLPASTWFAAMNACDPNYRASMEIIFNEQPANVCAELLKSCVGNFAVMGSQLLVRVGASQAPVLVITDKDAFYTKPEEFKPFDGIDKAYNGIRGTYPAPDAGWASKADAPERKSAVYLAEDGGAERISTIDFPCVPYPKQVQRLMATMLKEGRKRRYHTRVLPSEYRPLSTLDFVGWNSPINGYIDKKFSIELLEDLPDGSVAIAIREEDPSDYDFDVGDELPEISGWVRRPPRTTQLAPFTVEAGYLDDEEGTVRVPTIDVGWIPRPDSTGIRVMARRAGDHAQVPIEGLAFRRPSVTAGLQLIANGAPVEGNGAPVGYYLIEDETTGLKQIHGRGILPLTAYEVNVMYDPPTLSERWADTWLPVTTFDIRIGARDLEDEINDKIEEGVEASGVATDIALSALAAATSAEATVAALNGPVLDRLENIEINLASLDTGTVQELLGQSIAGRSRGWAKDPTFALWTGASLDYWTTTGLSGGVGTKSLDGAFPSSLLIDAPSGALQVDITASSAVTGQVPSADPMDDYVVLQAQIRGISGSFAGSELRVEWRATGTSTWTRGHTLGRNNWLGAFSEHGLVVSSTRFNSVIEVWKRPITDADAIRLVLVAKKSTSTLAVSMRVDYLDIGPASEADVKAYNLQATIDASITTYDVIIRGPTGSIAASMDALRSEFDEAVGEVSQTVVTVSDSVSNLSGILASISSSFGGQNKTSNPAFEDGVRAAGVTPNGWSNWDNTFRVIQRDPGSTSPGVAQAPTRYVARHDADGAGHIVLSHDVVACKPGDKIHGSFRIHGTLNSTGVFRSEVRFFSGDAETAVGSPVSCSSVTIAAANDVQWLDSDEVGSVSDQTVPAGASYYRHQIRVATGATGVFFFTDVRDYVVDRQALATAETALVASTSANDAVTAWNTRISAQFGNFNAFIDQTAGAVSWVDGAASSYVLKVGAGGLTAGLRIFAIDEPGGTQGAGVVLDGDVIAPKSLATSSLVIADLGYNMVPDNALQVDRDWARANGGGFWQHYPSTPSETALSKGELRWVSDGSDELPAYRQSTAFGGFHPGQRLLIRGQFQRIGGSRLVASPQIIWLDKNGSQVGVAQSIDRIDTTSAALQLSQALVVVPSGAFQMYYRFVVWPGTVAAGVRCFYPFVVTNENASTLITPDEAFFNQLTAKEAWIGTLNVIDLNVVRAKIGNGSVSDQGYGFLASSRTIAEGTAWTSIAADTINKEANKAVQIFAAIGIQRVPIYTWFGDAGGANTSNGDIEYRVVRNGVVIWTTQGRDPFRSWWPDNGSFAGSATYTLQVRALRGDTPAGPGSTFGGTVQSLIVGTGAIGLLHVAK